MASGVKYFDVGGSVGFDMIVAEYLLDLLDKDGKEIKVISILPFPEWWEKCEEEEICRQDEIMRRSDKTTFVWDAYCKDVYLIRDRKLVDESGYCISYCKRCPGGTAHSVR